MNGSNKERFVQPITREIKDFGHRGAARIASWGLRPGILKDPKNRTLLEQTGMLFECVDDYYRVGLTQEERNDYSQTVEEFPGIDFNDSGQLSYLEIIKQYANEYNQLPLNPDPNNPQKFYRKNDAFRGIDPDALYAIIRHYKPGQIIEVGSGFSTLVLIEALEMNRQEGIRANFTTIDPYSRPFINEKLSHTLIRKPVQAVIENNPELFKQLGKNDILFIDSSHVVNYTSDVTALLKILAQLNPGVLTHFHDIFFPKSYPEYLVREGRNWAEQMLIEAYLMHNNRAEVVFGSSYMAHYYPDQVKEAFPNALYPDGASLWIRQKAA